MKKEYFSVRKSKAYGLCGVALAVAFLATGNVSADEAAPTSNSSTPDVTLTSSATSSNETSQTPTETTTNETPTNAESSAENGALKVGNVEVKDPNPTVEMSAIEGKGSYTVELKEETKTTTETNTSVEWKPMDLVAILDFSGSTSGKTTEGSTEEKEGYRVFMYENLKSLIEKDLTDDSYVQIAFYGGNTADSYAANEFQQSKSQFESASTNLIPKKDALSLLNALINQKATDLFSVLLIAHDYLYDQNAGVTPFEAIYQQQKKNDLVSVIQFTDEWNLDEEIDTSFADWAKSSAKTFMSVLYKDTGAYSTKFGASGPEFNGTFAKSKTAMEAAGHPNIYVWNEFGKGSKSEDTVKNDVIKTFENTAVEKSETKTTTTVIKPKLAVTLGVKDAKLKSVVLTKPDGTKQELEIKLDGDLAEFPEAEVDGGKYQIDWVAESTKGGSVLTLVQNNGEFVINDTKNIEGQSSVFLVIVDENGNEVKRHRVAAGKIGEDYTIQKPTVGEGASIELVSGDLTGQLEDKDKEVVFKVTLTPQPEPEKKPETKPESKPEQKEEPKTEKPAEAPKTSETKKAEVKPAVKTLPNTGTEASAMSLVGAVMASLSGAGAFITKRKRR